MNKSKEILDKHLLKNGWTKEIKKESNLYNTLVDAMEEAINYSQCCMGETELDEDVSINIQHKSLGKFNLVKKQDSETEQLCEHLDKNNNCRMSCLTRCVEGNKFWK